MRSDTPYSESPRNQPDAKRECMRRIFQQAKQVPIIYEPFGGTGLTAGVLLELFPKSKLIALELNAGCAEIYNARHVSSKRAKCEVGDGIAGLKRIEPQVSPYYWGVSLDWNQFTVSDLNRASGEWKIQLIDSVLKLKPAWIQVTDTAVAYVHTNWKKYGMKSKERDGYFKVLDRRFKTRFGLKLKQYACRRAAAYVLFENGE